MRDATWNRNVRAGMTMSRPLRSLVRDVRGAVAVYVAIVSPALLGIGALSIDLGRLMTVNTELQSAADAAALAGAAAKDRCGKRAHRFLRNWIPCSPR